MEANHVDPPVAATSPASPVAVAEPYFGICFDLDDDVYRARPGIAQSSLKEMELSPAHYKSKIDSKIPSVPSPEMAFGTAVHTALLQPHLVKDRYVIKPAEVDYRTRDGRKWKEENLAAGREPIDGEDADSIGAIYESVMAHPLARVAIETSRHEVVMFAPIEVDGVVLQRKGKADMIVDDGSAVADLKTCRYGGAHPDEWGRHVADYQYHVQAKYYLDILNACIGTEQFDTFVHICVETRAPWAVACYRVTPEALEHGRKQYMSWLSRVAECTRLGTWPAYPTHLMPVDLPRWKIRQAEEALDL